MVNKFVCGFLWLTSLVYCPLNAIPDEGKSKYNLSSRIQDMHHGMKDDQYYVDGSLFIKNDGNKQVESLNYTYSVCLTSDKDPNKNDSCINGSGGLIAKLEPSKEFKKEIHLKGHKGHKFEGNANITVMFLDGNVNPFYQAHHKLGIIGNYK